MDYKNLWFEFQALEDRQAALGKKKILRMFWSKKNPLNLEKQANHLLS